MANRLPSRAELASAAPSLPLVLYDGDCAFCRAQAERVRRIAGDVRVAPLQSSLATVPWIDPDEAVTALHLVDRDGRAYAGAAAIVRLVRLTRPWLGALLLPYHLPGLRQLAERAYAWAAARRYALPGAQPPGDGATDATAACDDGTCGVPWSERGSGSSG